MGSIFIVDPSVLDRKRMRAIMEAAGHTVIELSDCSEAMSALQDAKPGDVSLVMTELHFDAGNGMAFLRWLKAHPVLRWAPVLVATAQPAREVVIEMVKAGAATIITKPYGPDMLLRRVTEALVEQAAIKQGVDEHLQWHFADYLRRELKRARRGKTQFSAVVARVQDTLSGRAVPALVSELVHLMRETDVLARLGDDQLVILLPETDAAGAHVVESRVCEAARALAEDRPDRPALAIAVATGTATFPSEAGDGEALVGLARERAV